MIKFTYLWPPYVIGQVKVIYVLLSNNGDFIQPWNTDALGIIKIQPNFFMADEIIFRILKMLSNGNWNEINLFLLYSSQVEILEILSVCYSIYKLLNMAIKNYLIDKLVCCNLIYKIINMPHIFGNIIIMI